ncbi:MAG: putative peptidoglycan D,D-transpeptidase FtsI [Hyphomicrobiaceae bacterium hypho_1]
MNIPDIRINDAKTPDFKNEHVNTQVRSNVFRLFIVGFCITVSFIAVAIQLIRLASVGQNKQSIKPPKFLSEFYSRPDIVDRYGRLLATDVALPALFADTYLITNVDKTVKRVARIFPELDTDKVRQALSDKKRRYFLLKSAVAPDVAQAIQDTDLPGLSFRSEPKRSYPNSRLAGHLLGYVDVYNYGIAGVERVLNAYEGVRRADSVTVNTAPPLRLTIDMRIQYGLEQELRAGIKKFNAEAAAGILIDVHNGEIWAAASLPGVEPANVEELKDWSRRDRLTNDAFELGSVFKVFTLAMVLELGIVTPKALVDVTKPIKIDGLVISDVNPFKGRLTLGQIIMRSSNIGASVLADAVGGRSQYEFLKQIGLTRAIDRKDVKTVAPKLPSHWGAVETATIGFGHGIAVSPLQFTVAFVSMINGGIAITPTLLRANGSSELPKRRLIRAETSAYLRKILRKNVLNGNGWRARVAGYRVGGKTGTADLARNGEYDGKSVIASFAAAFPMDKPRYALLVTLFDPKAKGSKAMRSAAITAAPVAGAIIRRVAPVLGVEKRTALRG